MFPCLVWTHLGYPSSRRSHGPYKDGATVTELSRLELINIFARTFCQPVVTIKPALVFKTRSTLPPPL